MLGAGGGAPLRPLGRSPLESPLGGGLGPLGGRGGALGALGDLGAVRGGGGALRPVVGSRDALGDVAVPPHEYQHQLGGIQHDQQAMHLNHQQAEADAKEAKRQRKRARKEKRRREEQERQERERAAAQAALDGDRLEYRGHDPYAERVEYTGGQPAPQAQADDWGFSDDFNRTLSRGGGFPAEAAQDFPAAEEDKDNDNDKPQNEASRKLYLAVSKSKPKHVRKYLRQEPDLSYRPSAVQDSLLITAVRAGSTEVLGDLVKAGLDVNETHSFERETALMVAAQLGDSDMVKALLKAGADWTAADAGGRLAVDHAREHGAREAEALLADPVIECRFGCGAQDLRAKDQERHERACPAKVHACPHGCGAEMTGAELDSHDARCPQRPVRCENGCQLVLRETAGHDAVCPRREVECREGCGAVLPLGERDEHEQLERRQRETALQGLRSSNARSWDPQQVAAWLRLVGMADYAPAFLESAVDGQLLVTLQAEDLASELGIYASAHLEALSAAVAELREPEYDLDFAAWEWSAAKTLVWLRQLCPRLARAMEEADAPLHGLLLLRGLSRATCMALLPDASAAVRRSLRHAGEEWRYDQSVDDGDAGNDVARWSLDRLQQALADMLGDEPTAALRQALDARCVHGAVFARMTPDELMELGPGLKKLHVKRLQSTFGLPDEPEESESASPSFQEDFEPELSGPDSPSPAPKSPEGPEGPETSSAPGPVGGGPGPRLDAVDARPEQTVEYLAHVIDWGVVVRHQEPAKLLRRPPIRLVHAVIAAACRATGFARTALSRRDLSYARMDGKLDVQKEFFGRVISIVACAVDRKLRARARSILTGRDADATNEFLQCLAVAAFATTAAGGGGAGTPRKRFESAQKLDGVIALTQWLAAINIELADAAGPLVRVGIGSIEELQEAGPGVVSQLSLSEGLAGELRGALSG